MSTVRRWLESDKIPEPILTETVRRYKVYSRGELELISRHLYQHGQEFDYLVSRHNTTVEMLHQAMHAYRAQYI